MGQKADGGTLRLGEKRFVPSFATVLQRPRALRAAPPAPAAALRALRAVLENAARFLSSAPCRVRIPAFGQQKARYREGNGLLKFDGAPNGIRTRDIHLERVASLAARRWGQRS